MDLIYADPYFYKAVSDVRERLKNGTAQWYSFDEVFDDKKGDDKVVACSDCAETENETLKFLSSRDDNIPS